MKRVNSFFGFIFLAAVAFSSCQDHQFASDSERVQLNGDQIELHIGLNVSGNIQAGLRSIEADDEKAIESIDVLAFEVVGDDTTFAYSMTGDLSDDGKKMVILAQTKYNVDQQFVVITNAAAKIQSLLIGGSIKKKSDLYTLLKFSLLAATAWKAKVNASTEFQKFPMWGETEPIKIIKDTNGSDISPVKLRRMVARIDVVCGLVSSDKFELDSVYLYNTNTEGYIVPADTNATSVNVPPIEEGESKRGIEYFIGYKADHPKENPDGEIRTSIYTFEAKAQDNPDSATCVVIAGYHGDDKTNGKGRSYYRVDFLEKDKKTHIDILRNHQYLMIIRTVNARGYDTKEDAFGAKALNLDAEVDVWAGAEEEVEVNEQYHLSVSSNSFEPDRKTIKFSKEKKNNTLTVETDYPKGWEASVSGDGGVTFGNGTTTIALNTNSSLSFNVSDYKMGDATDPADKRTNTITVKAGRLNRDIIIKQANVDSVIIEFKVTPITDATFDGSILKLSAATDGRFPTVPIAVDWGPNQIAGLSNSIILWLTPEVGLDYTPRGDGAASITDDLVGIRWSNRTGFISHAELPPSTQPFKKGLRYWGRVDNGFIIVEKSIEIVFEK